MSFKLDQSNSQNGPYEHLAIGVAMNEIFSRKTLIYHILRKKVPSVSLTVDSGPTYKPAAEIIAILSIQLLQCSRFITVKCI